MDKSPMSKEDAATMQKLELWVESRFHAEFLALGKMKAEMDAHKALLAQNSAENQVLIELIGKIKVIMSLLTIVEKAAVWITKVAAGCLIIWASWRYLISEAIKQMRTGG